MPNLHELKCLIEGRADFLMTEIKEIGGGSVSGQEVSISGGDCVYIPPNWQTDVLKGGHWIGIRYLDAWSKNPPYVAL